MSIDISVDACVRSLTFKALMEGVNVSSISGKCVEMLSGIRRVAAQAHIAFFAPAGCGMERTSGVWGALSALSQVIRVGAATLAPMAGRVILMGASLSLPGSGYGLAVERHVADT